MSDANRGAQFRALHQKGNPFILANAWDQGSAKMLANLGAQAIGTSSLAHAFTLGRPDGTLSRDEALTHAQSLVHAVNIPVSGDFSNGFADDPDGCALTVKLAYEVGLAGISIEDTPAIEGLPYARELASERIKAAAAAARALPGDFVLVARADGVMNAQYDLAEAMKRTRRFEAAGADCLYIPLPGNLEDFTNICASTSLPVNVLTSGPLAQFTRSELAKAGAARISLGSSLARLAHRAIHDQAIEMFENGNFSPLSNAISGKKIDKLLV